MPNQFMSLRRTIITVLFTSFLLLNLAWAAPKESGAGPALLFVWPSYEKGWGLAQLRFLYGQL